MSSAFFPWHSRPRRLASSLNSWTVHDLLSGRSSMAKLLSAHHGRYWFNKRGLLSSFAEFHHGILFRLFRRGLPLFVGLKWTGRSLSLPPLGSSTFFQPFWTGFCSSTLYISTEALLKQRLWGYLAAWLYSAHRRKHTAFAAKSPNNRTQKIVFINNYHQACEGTFPNSLILFSTC